MTITIGDLATRVLRRIKILPAGECTEVSDANEILDLYNIRMHALLGENLTVTDASGVSYTHVDQSLSDEFPLQMKHYDGIISIVAGDALEAYNKSMTAELARAINDGWERLNADFLVISEMTISGALTDTPSQRRQYF